MDIFENIFYIHPTKKVFATVTKINEILLYDNGFVSSVFAPTKKINALAIFENKLSNGLENDKSKKSENFIAVSASLSSEIYFTDFSTKISNFIKIDEKSNDENKIISISVDHSEKVRIFVALKTNKNHQFKICQIEPFKNTNSFYPKFDGKKILYNINLPFNGFLKIAVTPYINFNNNGDNFQRYILTTENSISLWKFSENIDFEQNKSLNSENDLKNDSKNAKNNENCEKLEKIKSMAGHSSEISVLAVSSDWKFLVTGSSDIADTNCVLWELFGDNDKPVANLTIKGDLKNCQFMNCDFLSSKNSEKDNKKIDYKILITTEKTVKIFGFSNNELNLKNGKIKKLNFLSKIKLDEKINGKIVLAIFDSKNSAVVFVNRSSFENEFQKIFFEINGKIIKKIKYESKIKNENEEIGKIHKRTPKISEAPEIKKPKNKAKMKIKKKENLTKIDKNSPDLVKNLINAIQCNDNYLMHSIIIDKSKFQIKEIIDLIPFCYFPKFFDQLTERFKTIKTTKFGNILTDWIEILINRYKNEKNDYFDKNDEKITKNDEKSKNLENFENFEKGVKIFCDVVKRRVFLNDDIEKLQEKIQNLVKIPLEIEKNEYQKNDRTFLNTRTIRDVK